MPTKRDYYEILGVERTSDGTTLKKAYRRLAMQYHPDRNPDDPSAEERFKEASEAFQVLNDANKRETYDRFGHAGLDGQGFHGFNEVEDIFGSFSDIFGDLFGGGRRRRRPDGPARGGDVEATLQMSLKEAAFGIKKEIEVEHPVPCEDCNATGAENGQLTPCPDCQGSGQVAYARGAFMFSTTCTRCGGRGRTANAACESCAGQGQVPERRKVMVSIPAGVDNGQTLRLTGQGQPGARGGPPGHLYVVLVVDEDERFERDGADLIYPLELSFPEAALGTKVKIPSLEDEERELKVPAGTQPGQTLVLRGAGIPNLNGRGRGDIVAVAKVQVPRKLSRKAKQLLRELSDALD